jgi:hypothetical protein
MCQVTTNDFNPVITSRVKPNVSHSSKAKRASAGTHRAFKTLEINE